jgi:hypothetical protein
MFKVQMKDNIKMDFREVEWDIWTGFVWLGVGTSGRLSCEWWWNFGFYKMLGITRSAGDLLSYQGGSVLSEVSFIIPKEHLLWCCIN